MHIEKWTHIALTLCAALMLLFLRMNRAGMEAPAAVIEMVPLSAIADGPAPGYSVTDPPLAPLPGTLTLKPRKAVRPVRRPVPLPAALSLAEIPHDVEAGVVAESLEISRPPEVVPAERPASIVLNGRMRPPEEVPDLRLESAVAAAVKRAAPRVESSSASGEQIHRDVVAMIKRYIETHHGGDAQPLELASAGSMTPIGLPTRQVKALSGGRWILGASAGHQSLTGGGDGAPGSALCSDLFWGRELSPRLQMGLALSASLLQGESVETGGGTALLQGGLQMRLFLHPQAKLSPFALLGGGYGQYSDTGESGKPEKGAAPVAIAGAGVEYRFSRLVGAQVVVAYEQMQVKKNQPEGGSSAHGVWELKAGLSLAIGGPRIISSLASGGLAEAKFFAE